MECGEDTIEVVFLTQEIFEGRVFVVGHVNETECVTRDTGKKTTSITIRKDQCGVVTTRSVSLFSPENSGLSLKYALKCAQKEALLCNERRHISLNRILDKLPAVSRK